MAGASSAKAAALSNDPGDQEKRHGDEQAHRLFGHNLQRLAGSADLGVRAARAVRRQDEEQAGKRQHEHGQKQVAATEEDAAGQHGERQRARRCRCPRRC